jgi:hypothetical protein
MRQVAFPAALGGCAFGVVNHPVFAAEWSITPSYSSSVDYDSNRRLELVGKGTSAFVLATDIRFKRALEDLEFTFEPKYSLRRFSDSAFGNGDDRTVDAAINWTREKSTLSLTASYWDQSTLTTDVLETGIISGDTHRRAAQAGANWNWNQTERRSLVAQFSYMDVSFYGQNAALLPGYRYPSGSMGERFFFDERGSFTVSGFGSRLQSDARGNSSHEAGVQAEVLFQFSEKAVIDGSLGTSSRVLSGASSRGTNASLSLNYSLEQGKATVAYTRSLVPYGFGFLVEQQQYTASLVRSWGPFFDSTLSFLRTQNNENAVLLRIDRRNYNTLSATLIWRPLQTWAVTTQVQGMRTQTPDFTAQAVKGWKSSVTLTWTPLPTSQSW